MQNRSHRPTLALSLFSILGLAPLAHAVQDELFSSATRQWIAPTARARALAVQPTIAVSSLAARVRIDGAVAHTVLRVAFANDADRPAEAEFLLPVPRGAVIDGFDFQGTGSAPSARLLPADEARTAYDEIVARLRDPALLEFVGSALVRSSVFPVPAHGTQTVELAYHEILPADGGRVDYELPRSAALGALVPLALELEVTGAPAAVYSPTHALRRVEGASGSARWRVDATEAESGSFRCSVLAGDGPRVAFYACPDRDGPGGTFLVFAGAPEDGGEHASLAREVTVVIDRSGSMAGEKFEQARTAALQVIEGLRPGERFRVVDYSDSAAASSAAPQPKSPESIAALRSYLAGLTTGGGTNLAAALETALAPPTEPGTVPVVLFLTDGLATVGPSSEAELRALARERNVHARRIFTFGVGDDVNAPLLDALALGSRATSVYVRPREDVERAVGGVFRRLAGPRMAGLELAVLDPYGGPDATLVRDVLPRQLPDLFAGGQLVLVGRYTAARPLVLEIRAGSGGGPLRVTADLATAASPRNEFVPRLWATRRIGELTDAIRQSAGGNLATETLLADPRTRELADEVLRLSLRHGVLNEFTAFLALEGSTLAGWESWSEEARRNLVVENARWRSGAQAIAYARNNVAMQHRGYQNYPNVLVTADGLTPPINAVQPVTQGALYSRGTEWIEGRLLEGLAPGAAPRVDEEVVIGSAEHRRIVDELAADGRSGVVAQQARVLFEHRGRNVRQVPEPPAPLQVAPR